MAARTAPTRAIPPSRNAAAIAARSRTSACAFARPPLERRRPAQAPQPRRRVGVAGLEAGGAERRLDRGERRGKHIAPDLVAEVVMRGGQHRRATPSPATHRRTAAARRRDRSASGCRRRRRRRAADRPTRGAPARRGAGRRRRGRTASRRARRATRSRARSIRPAAPMMATSCPSGSKICTRLLPRSATATRAIPSTWASSPSKRGDTTITCDG